MKYLRNGQNSGSLTPLWPMMRGYGLTPFAPQPSAGPNGGYDPFTPTMLVFEEEPSPYTTPPSSVSPPPVAPTTSTGLPLPTGGTGTSETSPLPSEAPTTSTAIPVHPLKTGSETLDVGTGTVEEGGDEAHPEVKAEPAGGGAPLPTVMDGEYVGGTELGPEAGVMVYDEEKKQWWPVVLGVGASVGVLALIAIAAWGGKK